MIELHIINYHYPFSSLLLLDDFEANLRRFIVSSVIALVDDEGEFYLDNNLLFVWDLHFSKKNHTNIWVDALDIDMLYVWNQDLFVISWP